MEARASRLFIWIIVFLSVEGAALAQGPPFAEFLTEDDAWCELNNNQTSAEILISGDVDTSRFELLVELRGKMETLVNLPSGIFTLYLNNQLGRNEYIIHKVIEHQEYLDLETEVFDTLVMVVHPYPDLTFTVDEGDFCSPADVILRAKEGYPKYTWDFGDGSGKTTVTNWVIHTYDHENGDQALVFPTKLKVETDFGCVDSVSGSVEIFPTPEADFTALPQTLIYPELNVTLSNLSSEGSWNYDWNFGDGTSSPSKEPGIHAFSTYGVFDITLKAYSAHCMDSMTRQIQILPPPPVAAFSPDTSGCPPLMVHFTNSSLYADNYTWNFDDGTNSSEANPTHIFTESKEHHVSLYVSGLSGSDQSEELVLIHSLPQAYFEPANTDPGKTSEEFAFHNSSVNALEYTWDFGDGTTSDEESPSHVYRAPGTYTITLYATSAEGCMDTLVRESLVTILAGEGAASFPNAFVWNGTGPTGGAWTPGSDDLTVFHPKLTGATKLRMIIFTRLGHKIFESNEVYVGWDGYVVTGDLAAPGVYVYKAWITYTGGLQEVQAGDVTFLYPAQ
jgi:PKD repeat protein